MRPSRGGRARAPGKVSSRQLVDRQLDFTARLWRTMRRGDAVRFVADSVARTAVRLRDRLRAQWSAKPR